MLRRLFIALLAVLMVTGVASPTVITSAAIARDRADNDKLGRGDYFVFVFPGLDLSQPENRLTTVDWDVLSRFDTRCRTDAKFQNPAWVKTVLLTALRNAPGAFAGGAIGALAGNFTYRGGPSAINYGAYNGIAAVGSGIGSGITAHEMGKHASIAGCMMGMVNEAKRLGALRHVIITYNAFPVNGHAIRRSRLPAPTAVEMERAGQFPRQAQPATQQEEADQPADLLPPPR